MIAKLRHKPIIIGILSFIIVGLLVTWAVPAIAAPGRGEPSNGASITLKQNVAHVQGSITDNVSVLITPTTGSPVTVNLTAGQTVTAVYNSQTGALEWLMVSIPWPTPCTPGTWPEQNVGNPDSHGLVGRFGSYVRQGFSWAR
jgi:hypothetical protein